MILAVADGSDYQQAARAAGRQSGAAVSHRVARFNREGLAARDPRRAGGRTPTSDTAARQRSLREAARTPTPDAAGTATGSLSTLRRSRRAAADGLPSVSTCTIGRLLRQAGTTLQQTRSWCPTGSAVRRRKAGVVAVTDAAAGPQKSGSRTPTRSARRWAWPSGARTRPAPSRRSRIRGPRGSRRGSRPARRTNMSAAARPRY